jgi:hypothetical protein
VRLRESGGVEEPDRVDQEVGEMALLEPVQHARREEKELITVTAHISICHGMIILDRANSDNIYCKRSLRF